MSSKAMSLKARTRILAKEKNVAARSTLNTRSRDFYDIYILVTTQDYDAKLLSEAVAATAEHRGTTEQIKGTAGLLQTISESRDLQEMWSKYQWQFTYANAVTWEKIMQAVKELCAAIGFAY